MGEAKIKSRSRAEILLGSPRCTYCTSTANEVEHMPPRAMFKGKQRPSGLEFPCCNNCNQGSKNADLVATFLSKISSNEDLGSWQLLDAIRYKTRIRSQVPGLLEEIFEDNSKITDVLFKSPRGLLTRGVQIRADGPILRRNLDIFSAKLGMALFREHVGQPVPEEGAVQSVWFLNAIPPQTLQTFLNILPGFGMLEQGRKKSDGQFEYRYNTDNESILASVSHFHNSIFILNIACAGSWRRRIVSFEGNTSSWAELGAMA